MLKHSLLTALLCKVVVAIVAVGAEEANKITTGIPFEIQRLQSHFDNYNTPNNYAKKLNHRRFLDQSEDDANNDVNHNCEIKFISCLTHAKCVSCFTEINDNDIDWSFVAADTTCDMILDVLSTSKGKCTYLKGDMVERKTFCETFDRCVVFEGIDDDDDDDGSDKDGSKNDSNDKKINCDELTSCDFDGYKPSYIGDGVCHEFIGGCYNHKICNYDGGDCCPDTCKDKSDYAGCGTDGYFCRDPRSSNCTTCEGNGDNKDSGDKTNDGGSSFPKANCTKDESEYQLLQFDTFGDGWESSTDMNITAKDGLNAYRGKLQSGFKGSEVICLSNKPTCYEVYISGGSWGNDISWQIKPKAAGSREVASGGSPMHCEFPIAGAQCENTCLGQTKPDAYNDHDYESFSDLTACMHEKCVIQYHVCSNDDSCKPCLSDKPPPYCLTNGNYNALVFCSQCNCVKGATSLARKEFCSAKSRNEIVDDDWEDKNEEDSSRGSEVAKCDWQQRKLGMEALTLYTNSSGIDVKAMLELFKFDSADFGVLDKFENCGLNYVSDPYNNPALQCMQLLQEAVDNPAGTYTGDQSDNVPVDAIKAIAQDLLHNGHDFCDTASKATELCPPCDDFIQFKVLLYESLDACKARPD